MPNLFDEMTVPTMRLEFTVPRIQQTVVMMVREQLQQLEKNITALVNGAMVERVDKLEESVRKHVDEEFTKAIRRFAADEVYVQLDLPENKEKMKNVVAKALEQILA